MPTKAPPKMHPALIKKMVCELMQLCQFVLFLVAPVSGPCRNSPRFTTKQNHAASQNIAGARLTQKAGVVPRKVLKSALSLPSFTYFDDQPKRDPSPVLRNTRGWRDLVAWSGLFIAACSELDSPCQASPLNSSGKTRPCLRRRTIRKSREQTPGSSPSNRDGRIRVHSSRNVFCTRPVNLVSPRYSFRHQRQQGDSILRQ